jgi:hypothetical protein
MFKTLINKFVFIIILMFVISVVNYAQVQTKEEVAELIPGRMYNIGEDYTVMLNVFEDKKYVFISYPDTCYAVSILDLTCTKYVLKKIFNSYVPEQDEIILFKMKQLESERRLGSDRYFFDYGKFRYIIIPLFLDKERLKIVGSIITIEVLNEESFKAENLKE